MSELLVDRLDRLRSEAATLAAGLGARARGSTTIGAERAMLRLIGVGGLSNGGRPLAGAVIDRAIGEDRSRLAAGILLPFAALLDERGGSPMELAHAIADGEPGADLRDPALAARLATPDGRRAAEGAARRLVGAASARIDTNRTARLELIGLLGEARDPQVGTTLAAYGLDEARGIIRGFVLAGVDVIRVPVPASRELVDRLGSATGGRAERALAAADATVGAAAARRNGDDAVPAGSQRGLAALREIVDEAAAASPSPRYPRLATASPPFGAPEQAVVAAFERIDIVTLDPIEEIVGSGLDPARALADHAFARRLHRRAGTTLLLGAGPLAVGPDLARGVSSDRATRAGRALALQALGVELATRDGFDGERLVIGALPAWICEERDPATQALAAVVLRRLAFPDLALAFVEPELGGDAAAGWPFILAAALPFAGRTRLILRRPDGVPTDRSVAGLRAAYRTAAEVAASLPAAAPSRIAGPALEHATAAVEIALHTLGRLRDEGWESVLGDAQLVHGGPPLGGDGVVESPSAFDPFASEPIEA